MRKLLLSVSLLLAGLLTGAAAASPVALTGNARVFVDNALACTDATGATVVSVQDATGVFSARSVTVSNDGTDEVFVDFNGNTATTADTKITATGTQGGVFTLHLVDNTTNAITCVASAGESTTLRVVAWR